MDAAPRVIFIHGLWMHGRESHWFRQRLQKQHGFAATLFSYRSRLESLDSVLDALNRDIQQLRSDCVHLVGHSLGGLLALRLFERHPQQPRGRLVLLGSPVQGSAAARRLGGVQVGQRLLGEIANQELMAVREPAWGQARELGVIAGTRPVGLGRVITRFQEANDGTVAVRETEITGTADRIQLPVSHFGMLLSARVVDQTAHFLRDGHFSLT